MSFCQLFKFFGTYHSPLELSRNCTRVMGTLFPGASFPGHPPISKLQRPFPIVRNFSFFFLCFSGFSADSGARISIPLPQAPAPHPQAGRFSASFVGSDAFDHFSLAKASFGLFSHLTLTTLSNFLVSRRFCGSRHRRIRVSRSFLF